jgi:transposase
VHRELRRPNMTLAPLWEECRAATTDGFGYSWFCDLYREWTGRLKPTLRQVHLAGERLFVAPVTPWMSIGTRKGPPIGVRPCGWTV